FWEAWQDELGAVRILDPACGSGAFLIEAFDQLHAAYEASNDRLGELRGHRTLFDLDKTILENNLYGVDLNEEAIEICRLSLWIKTAERGKPLTSLDQTIRVGNSVVADAAFHPKAFDWREEFEGVFQEVGGFDVVVGNPPYVRQELLSAIKPYLEREYRAYHGMADLYVYFYELGLRLLRPGGLLSFVVTNKWMKSGYGEPLRRLFGEAAWVESVVDFGHAKQIFEDADVFPSIIVARKPTKAPKPKTARLCAIPREQLRIEDLSRQIETEGVVLPLGQLGSDVWNLEPFGVAELLAKINGTGIPLAEFTGVRPLVGIKTGFNEAFLVDSATKDALIAGDATCADLIKPYLRGQDFSRWSPTWAGFWMIALKSSENYAWQWADAGDDAERVFERTHPTLYTHLNQFREALNNRQDQGRFWWELRSCAYWDMFASRKLMYPEITWRSQWVLDLKGTLLNNTAYFLPSDDFWVLATANAPITWWYAWRNAMHGKDEALRFIKDFVQDLPVPRPTNQQREAATGGVEKLIAIARAQGDTVHTILDWLRVEHEIEKPSMKLQSPFDLDSDALVAEVKKLRARKRPLTAAGLKSLRDEHARTIEPAQKLAAEASTLEHQLSDLVNAAYGLTPDEVALMWATAPPRMPIEKKLNH
ncbi:MAG TPA: DNA methyltransferase, partial [Pirellulales bacterium]|nr:DNA methyltransferase [Pirellulales bacterium]